MPGQQLVSRFLCPADCSGRVADRDHGNYIVLTHTGNDNNINISPVTIRVILIGYSI